MHGLEPRMKVNSFPHWRRRRCRGAKESRDICPHAHEIPAGYAFSSFRFRKSLTVRSREADCSRFSLSRRTKATAARTKVADGYFFFFQFFWCLTVVASRAVEYNNIHRVSTLRKIRDNAVLLSNLEARCYKKRKKYFRNEKQR